MNQKNESERLFELFCSKQQLDWAPIPVGAAKTPDYCLRFGNSSVVFEIEQIESEKGFVPGVSGSRTAGAHVRHKISEARKQVQMASRSRLPAVLLIYNAIDPYQTFGTESHDFIFAMYGELTVHLSETGPSEAFLGKNAKLRHDTNTSFSGVGHLKRTPDGAEITIYENAHAEHPLPFEAIPQCFKVVRVEIEHAA